MAGHAPLRTVEKCQGLEQGQTQEPGSASEETSAMDNQTGSYPRADIRLSDAERDQAVAELGEHFQAGRLTQEEFDDRTGRALQARTGRDLTGLFTDLPRPAAPQQWTGEPWAGEPWAGPVGGPVPQFRGRGAGPMPVARFVIAVVLVAIIAGNVLGHTAHFGWLIPVVILSFVLVRLSRIRR
jgi:hypothetical protein